VFDGISLRPAGFQVEFFSSASTQCFVASNKTFVIVAFRGTEVRRQSNVNFRNIVADIVTDIKWHPVDSEQGGNVHRGFKDALDEIWDRPTSTPYGESLKTCLGRVRKTADQTLRPLWFTGHSLGAALATLAADRYGSVQGLYTFGSPRVGDSTFQADFHVNTYRFVNNNDIVTQLPSIGLFQHVGQLKYIDSAGVLHDNPDLWTRLKELFRGVFGHMFTSAGQLRSGFTGEIPIDHLTDHAPLYYALHTWDSYVAEQEDETASGGG
jgi:hypothetical protein